MAYKGCLLCAIFCHWFQSVSCIYIMLICWFLTGVSGRHTVSNLCMWLVPSKEWLSKGKEDWESFGSYHCNVLCSIVQIVSLTITFWRNQNLKLNVRTEAASSMSQLLPRSWQEKLSPISPGYWVGRRSQCCHVNIPHLHVHRYRYTHAHTSAQSTAKQSSLSFKCKELDYYPKHNSFFDPTCCQSMTDFRLLTSASLQHPKKEYLRTLVRISASVRSSYVPTSLVECSLLLQRLFDQHWHVPAEAPARFVDLQQASSQALPWDLLDLFVQPASGSAPWQLSVQLRAAALKTQPKHTPWLLSLSGQETC